MVVDQPTLHTLARPVLEQAATTARLAITAADLTPAQLAGVFCVGGGARLPAASQTLHDALGVPVTVLPDPDTAALLGAVDATATSTPPTRSIPAGRPGLRHYLAAIIPAAAAVLLLWQSITTALPIHIGDITTPIGSVITNWAGYAMIGLLLTQAALAIATIIATYLYETPSTTTASSVLPVPQLLARLLPAAALTGLTAAGLTAVIAALWQGVPAGPFLRWSLLPALPVAAAATTAAILLPRRPTPPTTTWLTTPVIATTAAATAMVLVVFAHTNTDPTLHAAVLPATLLGALLFGAATTLTLPVGRPWRLTAAAPLTLATAALTLGYATGVLATLYALTLTAWWLTRAATGRSSPATTDTAI